MKSPVTLGCLGALVLAVIIAALTLVGGYNSLLGVGTNADAALANVNVQYQRRADLIGNLVKTVEGAGNFERGTLTQVVEARAKATSIKLDASTVSDPEAFKRFQEAQGQLSAGLGRLLAVSENYPNLKTSEQFKGLSDELAGTENRIADARRRFNDAVQGYNLAVRRFPTVLYAGILGFRPREFFTNNAGTENAPSVSFPSFGPSPSPR